ncbi:unnamed protein product, partial [Mesorhabditis belari]|uniref:Transmembrane protein 53 n=1 Tax=Mesorhabditis belari TaxID=2138241 RepID=A0AAF3EER3_9BILA
MELSNILQRRLLISTDQRQQNRRIDMSNTIAPAAAKETEKELIKNGHDDEDGCHKSAKRARLREWQPPVRECYVEGSKTLVILFGWAGCRDRYLKKYADYYQASGISTVRFTAPISHIRHITDYQPLAQRVFDTVFGKEGDNWAHDVYFHVFSMNGCATFCAFWDGLHGKHFEESLKKRVKGIIFDSCPANVSANQSARAISFAAFPPSAHPAPIRESVKALLFTYFSVQRMIFWVRSIWEEGVYERNFAFFRMLAINDLPQRQLYLYGPGDDICSLHSIEKFAEVQRSLEKEVVLHCLPDSAHCQHMRKHQKEYQRHCLQFIDPNWDVNGNSVGSEKSASCSSLEQQPEIQVTI